MARWLRTVESNCKDPEREAEYINWYKTVHIPDVLGFKPGGMLTGDLYERQDVQPGEGKYMAIYEIEAEDIAQSEAARMASAVIQSTPDLIGMAGFDSESGPGMGMALRESRKVGQIVCTTVDAEAQHLLMVKDGIINAAIGQKRELFTYYGVKVLFEINHIPLKISSDDKAAGIIPTPEVFYTGSYTVTQENVDLFL